MNGREERHTISTTAGGAIKSERNVASHGFDCIIPPKTTYDSCISKLHILQLFAAKQPIFESTLLVTLFSPLVIGPAGLLESSRYDPDQVLRVLIMLIIWLELLKGQRVIKLKVKTFRERHVAYGMAKL
jgi:hypothetical protein